jgi:hypothetical protein
MGDGMNFDYLMEGKQARYTPHLFVKVHSVTPTMTKRAWLASCWWISQVDRLNPLAVCSSACKEISEGFGMLGGATLLIFLVYNVNRIID